jgi:tetratricopeptide (TPR) repeat protein
MEGEYLPGDTLAAHYSLGLPLLGRDRPLLPDGKVRTFAYQADHLYSACWYGGGMTCIDCHEPHSQGYQDIDGSPLSGPYDDGQCLDCHASKAADPTAHTHHGTDSPGSRCVACHMPYRQQPGVGPHVPYGRSDHTISIPRPGVDEEEGVPSACALCHDDVTTRELQTAVRTWYGALAPRPRLVEAVAAARRGGDSLPDGLRAVALVDPDEAARLPTAQVAALNELFLGYVRPDLGRERVEARDTALVARLRVLAGGDGFAPDVSGVSLALLHLGWGDVPAVRAFLDRRRGELGADPGRVTLRWARALQLMGDAWRARGRTAWALRAFTRAQEARPTDPSILLDLASAYTSLGRAEESLPYYVQAIRLDPTQSVALVNLGLTLESLGRDDQAEGAYRRAVEVDPSEALAHMNLGNMALRRGEAAAAAASYEAALLHDPGLSRAAFYLGVARVRLNDLRGARRALLAAREFAPDDEEVTALLRRVEEALAGGSARGPSGR